MKEHPIPSEFRRFPKQWKVMPFLEVISDETGGNPKVLTSDYLDSGSLPVIDQGNSAVAGYVNEASLKCKAKLPCILFGDHTKVFKFVDHSFTLGADGVKVLVPTADLDPKFAYHYLKQVRLPDNAGYSRHFKFLKETYIPLPPLPEQKRIAAILDKADSIRCKRQEAVRLTEELLSSAFLDMFGDPVTNPRGWDTCCLGDVLQKIESGWSPVCEEGQAEENEWGVLKLGAVTTCRYLDTESKALPASISPRRDLEVKVGDLLFTRKNTYDLVAASALVYATRPKLMISDLIFRLKLKDDSAVISEYLWALLSSTGKRKQIQSLAGGSSGSMPNISKSKLMEQMIEVPPMALQNKYSQILHNNYRIKNKLEAATQSSNILFNTLLQHTFKGLL